MEFFVDFGCVLYDILDIDEKCLCLCLPFKHNQSLGTKQTQFDSSPPGQNGRHFADDTFRCIFVNEKFHILIKISMKFVRKGPNDNNQALVQTIAWRLIGDKPLSEPMRIHSKEMFVLPYDFCAAQKHSCRM